VDNEVSALKTKWFPHLEPSVIEIHAWHIINQKGIYRTIGRANSLQLLTEVFELISKTDCNIVASVIHKSKIYARLTDDDIDLWSHRLLFERVCKFIEKDNSKKISIGQPADYGILLMDFVNPNYHSKVRKKYRRFFGRGTHYLQNQYLIENPLFVDSQYRNMSQLVDIVAHLINRYTNLRKKPRSTWTDVDQVIYQGYQILKPRFDKGANGQINGYGIKYFP